MSGVISPTNLSLFSSPVATPRSTPNARTTPVPRWNTGSFIALDDNMDYSMMSPLIAGTNQDQQGPPLMDDGKTSEPTDRALTNFHSFFGRPDSKSAPVEIRCQCRDDYFNFVVVLFNWSAERYFNPVVHGSEPMEAAAHTQTSNAANGAPSSSASKNQSQQPSSQTSQQQSS